MIDKDQVRIALADGPLSTSELAAIFNCSRKKVRMYMRRFVGTGHVFQGMSDGGGFLWSSDPIEYPEIASRQKEAIVRMIDANGLVTSSDIHSEIGITRSRARDLLSALAADGRVVNMGRNRGMIQWTTDANIPAGALDIVDAQVYWSIMRRGPTTVREICKATCFGETRVRHSLSRLASDGYAWTSREGACESLWGSIGHTSPARESTQDAVFRCLIENGEQTVENIASNVGLTYDQASAVLRRMLSAALVAKSKVGMFAVWRINHNAIEQHRTTGPVSYEAREGIYPDAVFSGP